MTSSLHGEPWAGLSLSGEAGWFNICFVNCDPQFEGLSADPSVTRRCPTPLKSYTLLEVE